MCKQELYQRVIEAAKTESRYIRQLRQVRSDGPVFGELTSESDSFKLFLEISLDESGLHFFGGDLNFVVSSDTRNLIRAAFAEVSSLEKVELCETEIREGEFVLWICLTVPELEGLSELEIVKKLRLAVCSTAFLAFAASIFDELGSFDNPSIADFRFLCVLTDEYMEYWDEGGLFDAFGIPYPDIKVAVSGGFIM